MERDGRVRSFHVPNVTAKTLKPIIVANVDKATYLMTDDSAIYPVIGREFSGHGSVNHSAGEYVRGMFWHTNTVENFFSTFKRGVLAAISTCRKPTCIGTVLSSISGTITAPALAMMISPAPMSRFVAWLASG